MWPRRSAWRSSRGWRLPLTFRDKEIHLLGFLFDADDVSLNRALADLRQGRSDRFREMLERLRALGVPLEAEELADTSATIALGRRHLAELLVKAGRAGTVQQAFQRYLGDRGRVSVPKRCLPVGEAIALIRGAGGVASWAHPSYDCTLESLQELRGLGMLALEVDFPSCRPGRGRELRAWAKLLDLAVTGGSDCHGPGLPRRAVGVCGLTSVELEQLR